MATQFEIEYALMAGASYISTRLDINKFPIPAGWATVQGSHFNDPSTSFEAAAFQSQCSNEIVISYAGTYDQDYFGDMLADAGLAMGLGSAQLPKHHWGQVLHSSTRTVIFSGYGTTSKA